MKSRTRVARNGAAAHSDTTEQLAAAAHRTVDRVAGRARALERNVRSRTAELGAGEVGATLRQRPLLGAGLAAGAALAVGAVLGGLMLRR